MNRNRAMSLELDEITAHLLIDLAQRWGVSEEEAVRRAVEQAGPANGSPNKQDRLQAFRELQRRLDLTPAKASQWQEAVREARR
jgi:hypothetical protein